MTSEPEPILAAVSPDAGKPVVARFAKAFRASGLIAVCQKAREAQGAEGRAELQAALAAAEKQLADLGENDPARDDAQRTRDRFWMRVEKTAPAAEAASRKVWASEWAVGKIISDLSSFSKALDQEMQRVVALSVSFARENGFPDDEATFKNHSAVYQAYLEFKTRHIDPAVVEFENRKQFPEAGEGRSIEQVSWLLAGCSWRQVETK